MNLPSSASWFAPSSSLACRAPLFRLLAGVLGLGCGLIRAAETPPDAATSAPAAREPRVRVEGPPVGDQSVVAGERHREAVSIGGSLEVAGEVTRDAVSVLGSAVVRPGGSVGKDLVGVLGSVEQRGRVEGHVVVVGGSAVIDGPVGREVVVVGGTLELGPRADLPGGYVLVGGHVRRDPAAKVSGPAVNVIALHSAESWSGARSWLRECLLWGRPLAFREGLGWAWLTAAGFVAFYLLSALVFRGPVERAVETLSARPGLTLLTTVLTVICTPVVFTVLSVSVVGLVLVPFLALALLAAHGLGQAALRIWLGRRLLGALGGGANSLGFALLLGAALVLLLYTVPFVGFVLVLTLTWLSMGVMVLVVALALRRPPAAAGISPGAVPPAPAPVSAAPGASVPPPAAGAWADPAALPRAGFLVRGAALAIDTLVVGIVVALAHALAPAFLLVLAAYGAVLWRVRGTTLGGTVCGLRVVRTDGHGMDWTTAWLRALGCFLSLLPLGLGFLWIAFDRDRQAWHDKVAGTVVVRVPRGVALT
ncbi:MAG: RDD family protein [Opitutaceae bacterium]